MPSNQTTNYQLNQWAKSDQVQMEDFNADNAKIDAALAQKADASALAALTTLVGVPVRLAAGSYAGDGAASRVIPLPFTPKAVFVILVNGYTYAFSNGFGPSAPYGGLAVTGHPAGASAEYPAVEIVSGGFQVSYRTENAANRTNSANEKYNYIALG